MLKGSSPAKLKVLLHRYFAALEELGVPVAGHLAPGLSEREIRASLERSGLSAPLEVVAWFETFNGTRFDEDETPFYLFPRFDLRPLDHALALYDQQVADGHVGYGDWLWHPERGPSS